MNIDTNKLVEILNNEDPISIMVVEDHGKDKLVCLFALPHLADKITEFGISILEDRKETDK
ncbi:MULTISPECIES: hypothetical protein [Sphingobacterium]|uniref:hypothetical protein n=1 Tax=Sphingobacterium TaxID=28453 RepID=UPI00257C6DFD|nr:MULTISPECIES: hypothetical protein [Sphingobacterium]